MIEKKERFPYVHTIELGGIPIRLWLEYKEASELFALYEVEDNDTAKEVSVSEKDWQDMQKRDHMRCGQIEASILTALCSDVLLPYDRVIIHAVAFVHQGKAWLITGDPGTGKSTQIRYLMDLYPDEFTVICGDRPVLEVQNSGIIIVHPSPWNGKENWHGGGAAPLAGILILERADKTEIQKLRPRDAAIPVFSSLISTRSNEELIRKLAKLETILLENIPVYQYHNGGVPDSTRYLYRFLTEGDGKNDV